MRLAGQLSSWPTTSPGRHPNCRCLSTVSPLTEVVDVVVDAVVVVVVQWRMIEVFFELAAKRDGEREREREREGFHWSWFCLAGFHGGESIGGESSRMAIGFMTCDRR